MEQKTTPGSTGQPDLVGCIGKYINIFDRANVFRRALSGNMTEKELYDTFQQKARNIKIVLQMFVGILVALIIILEVLINLILRLPPRELTKTTLEIVGAGLAISTAFELAYTLFTDGPDEAVEPLITGLAATILIIISQTDTISFSIGGGLALLVLALILLFILRHFFTERSGWNMLIAGGDAHKQKDAKKGDKNESEQEN
jgi:hypothetical protein